MTNKIIKLKPLIPPMIIARKYSGDLLRLVSEMVKDYWSLVGIYRNKRGQVVQDETWAITDLDDRLAKLDRKWQERFKEYAKNNSPKMIQKVLKQSDIQLKETLKDWFAEKRFMLFDKEIPTALRQVLRASIEENVMYISDLPVKYAGRVRGAVYRAVTGGGTLKDLQVSLRKYAGMSARHAKLVASDQINKAFVNISAQRMKQAGITKYMWCHTNAGKTHRPYHKRKWDGVSGKKNGHPNGLNGFIFDMSHQPIIDEKTGEIGLPGQLPYCYHKDTEVYTERGFVPIKDVFIGEKVLTLNPDTKIPEWSVCESVTKKYSDMIVNFSNNWFDLATDPNHRFFVYGSEWDGKNEYTHKKPRFITGIDNLPSKSGFYGASEWVGEEKKWMNIGDKKYEMDAFLRLLAWYLCEGSVDRRKGHNGIQISQYSHKSVMYDGLKVFDPHLVKCGINIYDSNLNMYFRKFGHANEKYIPSFVKGLSKRQIRVFLDAFALGDGEVKKTKNKNLFCGYAYNNYKTVSKRMADDLVELIIKTGFAVNQRITKQKGKEIQFKNGKYKINYDVYTVSEKKNVFFNLKSLKKTINQYNDFTYDIGVKDNHTLLIKYKNKIHWNSNCHCKLAPVITFDD